VGEGKVWDVQVLKWGGDGTVRMRRIDVAK